MEIEIFTVLMGLLLTVGAGLIFITLGDDFDSFNITMGAMIVWIVIVTILYFTLGTALGFSVSELYKFWQDLFDSHHHYRGRY